METSESLLKIENLTIDYPIAIGTVHAVRGVSLEVPSGQTLGILQIKVMLGICRDELPGERRFAALPRAQNGHYPAAAQCRANQGFIGRLLR